MAQGIAVIRNFQKQKIVRISVIMFTCLSRSMSMFFWIAGTKNDHTEYYGSVFLIIRGIHCRIGKNDRLPPPAGILHHEPGIQDNREMN
ncbi:MAG: hypothetical protein WC295_04995 [Methanoregula sp.]|jgi:hypothetical protein